jgi:hypothetical protein
MSRAVIRFIGLTVLILGTAFGFHLLILYLNGFPLFNHLIILAYLVNALLAIVIVVVLYAFRIKLKNQLGFLFMAGSLIKFAVFFIIFHPNYRSDGDISNMEFLTFFTPYVLSLILETYTLSKLLNKLDSPSS